MESKMKKTRRLYWVALIPILLVNAMGEKVCAGGESGARPRIIATTDGEIDDRCSMVRLLLNANEWDIEGIIIICEVTDDGSPELTRYQRVIVEFTNR